MAIAIEALRQYSHYHGGLAIYKREEDLSASAWRTWNNTPTIFALLVILLWEVVAQDVLRLEPYFQLACDRGASARVLFLSYRFDNGFLAPIRAFRNRHWVVVCVSSMSLLMRVPVPSLLSGLFVLSPLPLVETKVVETWPHLVGHDIQENWFSTEVAHRDWKASSGNSPWLSGSSQYATPPVSISLGDGDGLSTLTLMNQSVYWSKMSCSDVTVTGATPSVIPSLASATNVTDKHGFRWSLRNITLPEAGQVSQCTLNIDIDCLIPSSGGRFQARYWEPTQSNSTSRIRSAIHANNCPLAGLYGLVIDMESSAGSPVQYNITVFACEVIYHQAIANVSLTPNLTVTGVDIVPSTIRDLTQQQFSAAGLQRLMASRHDMVEDQQTFDSLLSAKATNTTTQAERSRIVVVGDSAIIGLPQYQDGIGTLWNHAFITAVDSFFDVAANGSRIEARLIMAAVSIQVVSHAAIIVETILVLGFALLLALSWIYPHRPSLLHEDPGTIVAQCSYIARLISPETLDALFRPVYHVARTRNLQHWAREFWCGWKDGCSGGVLDVYGKDGTHLLDCPHAGPQTVRRGRPQDPMPHFLTIPWFLVECMLLIGTVAAFGLAFKYMQSKDLQTFSSTEVTISALFLVYGPTVLSSMIRSLFNSVHRHLSIAEPWIRLRKGPAPPEVLLTSSHNPLTTLVVSLRSGTRVSAAVMASSVVCLLNLVLIVASGGLFEPQVDDYFASISLTATYNSSLFLTHGLELDFEGYDSTLYEVSSRTPAPWTTADFSYLPLENPELEISGSQALYTSSTRGIGVSLNCEAIPHEVTDFTSRMVNVTYAPLAGPANTSCTVNVPQDFHDRSRDTPQIHYVWPNDTEPLCQQSTFSVFVSRTGSASSLSKSQDFTVLHCEPRINIQDFQIDFATDGVIQRHEAIPGSPITSGPFFHNASKALGYFNQGVGRYVGYLRSHGNLPFYQSSFPEHVTTEEYKKVNNGSTELDTDSLIYAVQSVYQTAFSHYLSLRRDTYRVQLFPNTTAVVNGTATYPMWGFMPAKGCMITIMLLISVDIIFLLSVFALYHGRYDAPRIPKSLGSLIPWVASSSLLKDVQNTRASIDKQKEDVPGNEGQKYHFRSSFDTDGNVIWALDLVKAPT
ncbi:hypothetical protein AbraIFM66950_001574 [Aspergillus brasiliensis]|nr:hypothetical protein AbraIFM66950_001574 [Aspergillus brasiliensis]